MANPIVTTITPLENITNVSATLKGNTQNNGWETLEWGFWYYEESEGIGTKVYVASSTTPLGEGDFIKYIGSLNPFTLYVYQARAYYKKWNEGLEPPAYEYVEIFGDWEEFTTHAYPSTSQVFACAINKGTGAVTFYGSIDDSDGGNVTERGFQYGLTKTPTWEEHENGEYSECVFSLGATGLALNSNFYVRTYLKSASGHYAFSNWRAFTTKVLDYVFVISQLAGYIPDAYGFLVMFDKNGQESNSIALPVGHDPSKITMDSEGIAYYSNYVNNADTYLSKRRLSDGASLAHVASGHVRGISIGIDDYVYDLEGPYAGDKIYKRNKSDLSIVSYIDLIGTSYYGLGIDSDGYIYVGRTDTSPDKIEKYKFFLPHNITGVITGGPGEGNFKIAGDYTSEFTEGINIIVADSTGNNGNYTVKTGGSYLENGDTIIPVDEAISDPTVDGNITKSGVGGLIASINSPVSFGATLTNLIITGDYVYAGAWFDVYAKANKELSSIEKWTPSGDEWYSGLWFYGIGIYGGKIIVYGNPDSEYSKALAGYDKDRNRLWFTEIVGGTNGMGGYPFTGADIINIKATKIAGHLTLYGEITKIYSIATTIIERGFEYKIQDEEPGPEDEGTEVKEIGEFEEEEYHLSSWDTFNDLYRAEKNKIWWFRAYCLDDEENKYIAEEWMKNVPTMTTFECTEVSAQEAKGNGELIDLGANIVTLRGFRIIKEYSGDLSGAHSYRSDGFEGELEIQKVYSEAGTLIGFIWVGELHRDSLHEDEGGYELGIYDKILGGGFLGEGFGLYLKSNDNFKVVAIAENQLGMGFGGEVDLNTGQLILPCEDDEIVSNISAEKTVTLGTLPGGTTVTRMGIRLGRTMGCNEIHVFEDGEWGSGQSVTFFITDFVPGASYYKMPYIVINYGDHEEEVLAIPDYRNPERLEEWLEDYPIEVFPEVEDEDELDQTIIDSSVGDISYRTIIKEIKCERIGDQSFIDRYGRRRSQTVDNHLIQSRANCKIIIDDYIEKFQILKQKYALEYDIPIPFEREDCILLGDGKIKYKDDGQGLIAFKADGEGETLQEDFILAKIRKIDGRFISGKEAILNLELEV